MHNLILSETIFLCYLSTAKGDMNRDELFGRAVFVLLFFLCLVILTLASYLCTIMPFASSTPISNPVGGGDTVTVTDPNQMTITVEPPEPRLDQSATWCSYPSLLYSKTKLGGSSSSSCSCCSICLMDYKESDLVRMLPGCDHFFHVKCVDPWLRMNLTCPICRKRPETHAN